MGCSEPNLPGRPPRVGSEILCRIDPIRNLSFSPPSHVNPVLPIPIPPPGRPPFSERRSGGHPASAFQCRSPVGEYGSVVALEPIEVRSLQSSELAWAQLRAGGLRHRNSGSINRLRDRSGRAEGHCSAGNHRSVRSSQPQPGRGVPSGDHPVGGKSGHCLLEPAPTADQKGSTAMRASLGDGTESCGIFRTLQPFKVPLIGRSLSRPRRLSSPTAF